MALSSKRRAFVEHYLQCWNASEAARRAGYSERSAGQIGHRMLKEDEILEAIEARKQELMMSADEALIRLTKQGRATMDDILTVPEDGVPYIDIRKAQRNGVLDLIRKIKTDTTTIGGLDDVPISTMHVEVELYNAQSALELIGKSHKLFTDRVEHDIHGSVEITADDMAQARNAAQEFEDSLMDNSNESA